MRHVVQFNKRHFTLFNFVHSVFSSFINDDRGRYRPHNKHARPANSPHPDGRSVWGRGPIFHAVHSGDSFPSIRCAVFSECFIHAFCSSICIRSYKYPIFSQK
jgi:hypothetical protein